MFIVSIRADVVHIAVSKLNKINDQQLNDKISGTFNAFFFTGYLLASVAGGLLVAAKSFQFSCNVMCLSDVVFLILFIGVFVCGHRFIPNLPLQ